MAQQRPQGRLHVVGYKLYCAPWFGNLHMSLSQIAIDQRPLVISNRYYVVDALWWGYPGHSSFATSTSKYTVKCEWGTNFL